MDMIQVDPQLFVTCRLCLEELGQYQIVPSVQQQIKYCYDIDVEPFDGLPQLLCLKCKEVLTNFYTIKKVLSEKQTNLRSKIPKKDIATISIESQQDTVSSSQQPPENIVETKKKPKQKLSKIRKIIDSSDSESSINNASPIPSKKTKCIEINLKRNWDGAGFNKELICTICNVKRTQLKSLMNHRHSHTNLRNQFPSVFKRTCTVNLNKVDGKDNVSGMNNVVVHDDSKIIENRNSFFYYVKYSKEKQDSFQDRTLDNVSENSFKRDDVPGSSDSEQEITTKHQRRKRRIISRSSNDTIVIESNGNKTLSDNEDSKSVIQQSKAPVVKNNNDQCISIDDSTDSDTDRNEVELRQKQPLEAKLNDYKTIQSIISMCVNAYHRKNEAVSQSDRSSTEIQLKRKVLGIGRKILNRPGFNWAGLLRYMEHKNLGIIWVTKGVYNSKESNFIRIMTKLRGTDTSDDNQGWEPVPDATPIKTPVTSVGAKPALPSEIATIDEINTNVDSTAVIIYGNSPDPISAKLLNANPVANPKQLPRKLIATTEFRGSKVVTDLDAPFHNNEDTDLCMPIITSTTSLAVPSALVSINDNNTTIPITNTSLEATAPRIKVKPVTELMSERMLNTLREQSTTVSTSNMLQSQSDKSISMLNQNTNAALSQLENTNSIVMNQNVWVPQSMSNMYAPHMTHTQITANNQPMQLVQISCVNPMSVAPNLGYQNVTFTPAVAPSQNANSKDEYVLLNTVELPNTKTNSPFQYLKNLSRLHNLILIDPHETLSRDFVCLIKFKVQFKQEPIEEPVVLCLSLYCSQNRFCLTVRDRNQRDININKISPNWQWEIIKIFRGDLVPKLLQNSQKHSPDTHEYTNKFLCLLKSINFQKLS